MLPDWFVTGIANGTVSASKGISYGAGFSRDLLLIHHKGLPEAMCRADWKPPT